MARTYFENSRMARSLPKPATEKLRVPLRPPRLCGSIFLGSGYHRLHDWNRTGIWVGAAGGRGGGGARSLPFADAGLPVSSVPGHAGKLGGTPVVLMKGRVHLYEGHGLRVVTAGVRWMSE